MLWQRVAACADNDLERKGRYGDRLAEVPADCAVVMMLWPLGRMLVACGFSSVTCRRMAVAVASWLELLTEGLVLVVRRVPPRTHADVQPLEGQGEHDARR